ncbi:RNI-like protein [Infundibulicybe gibba]|nr:RNI-like protein [Infundibulicybe gibba]
MNIPKPPVGSFEDCAKCEKQFTVTKYTMAANPGPGFLCHQCAKATGSDPFKKPAVPKKRKTPAERRTVTNFDDKRFPSLVSICVQLVTRHINDVEALGDIGAMNTAAIAKAISKNRSLTPENAVLFYNVENTALTFYDATSLTPPALTTLAYLNPNLTSLKLDFCGRIDDEVMNAFATSLPQLTRIELLGPFLVRPAAWIAFFNTRQAMTAFLITQSPRFDLDCVKALITSCGDTLRELRLKEVGKLDDDFLVELAKAKSLTQLDLADPSKSCSPGAVIELMSAVGRNLTLLDLSGHNLLTDDFLNLGIAEYAHALSSLSLARLNELTDVGVSGFFENWNTNPGLKDIDMSRIYVLGEKALPSLLKHSGATVVALNLNGWGGVTAESLDILGRHTVGAELRKLDVGWWREVDDYVVRGWMGLDNNDDAGEKRKRGCLKLEELKVWGCNRVTPRCPARVGIHPENSKSWPDDLRFSAVFGFMASNHRLCDV